MTVEEHIRRLQAELVEARTTVRTLNPGGGDGTFGGMEPRVTKLEHDMGDLKVSVAVLTERVSHLPSKSYIGAWIASAAAILAAVTVFSDSLKHLVGLSH